MINVSPIKVVPHYKQCYTNLRIHFIVTSVNITPKDHRKSRTEIKIVCDVPIFKLNTSLTKICDFASQEVPYLSQ